MRVYSNAYPSAYEELRAISPPWQRSILEYDAWWQMLGQFFDRFRAATEQEIANAVIDNLDAQAIADYEKFFHISPRGTLDSRKKTILAYYRGSGRIGGQGIRDVIGAFTEGDTAVELRGGTIVAQVIRAPDEQTSIEPAREILRARIPAHLELLLSDRAKPIVMDFGATSGFYAERLRIKNELRHYDDSIIVLDGNHKLDGSWRLNQVIQGGWLERVRVKSTPFEYTSASSKVARVSTVTFEHTEELSVSLVKRSPKYLDGTGCLDGSRRLNGTKTEKEIWL